MKIALSSFCLALTLGFSGPLHAQQSDIDLATGEGARRQALKIELDRKTLSELAIFEPAAFDAIVEKAKAAIA